MWFYIGAAMAREIRRRRTIREPAMKEGERDKAATTFGYLRGDGKVSIVQRHCILVVGVSNQIMT